MEEIKTREFIAEFYASNLTEQLDMLDKIIKIANAHIRVLIEVSKEEGK